MTRVLVTGAGGFIGRHCLALLAERGAEVHAVDVVDGARDEELRGLATWHRFDMLQDDVADLVRTVRPSHLLHLAWITTPGVYPHADENRKWVDVGVTMARAFAAQEGRRLVAAGSCLEYAAGSGVCDERTTPVEPATQYGLSKLRLHVALEDLSHRRDLPVAWGRVFFLYGPYERPERLVPVVIRSLLRGEPAACSAGTQRRDFLHVADVATAFVALLESDVRGAVNIGSGSAVAVRDVALTIGRAMGREDLVRLGARPTPEGEDPLIVAARGRLHEQLGFRPQYDLETGLAQTIAWWRAREAQAGGGRDG